MVSGDVLRLVLYFLFEAARTADPLFFSPETERKRIPVLQRMAVAKNHHQNIHQNIFFRHGDKNTSGLPNQTMAGFLFSVSTRA